MCSSSLFGSNARPILLRYISDSTKMVSEPPMDESKGSLLKSDIAHLEDELDRVNTAAV